MKADLYTAQARTAGTGGLAHRTAAGFVVLTSADGDDIIALIEEKQNEPDLIDQVVAMAQTNGPAAFALVFTASGDLYAIVSGAARVGVASASAQVTLRPVQGHVAVHALTAGINETVATVRLHVDDVAVDAHSEVDLTAGTVEADWAEVSIGGAALRIAPAGAAAAEPGVRRPEEVPEVEPVAIMAPTNTESLEPVADPNPAAAAAVPAPAPADPAPASSTPPATPEDWAPADPAPETAVVAEAQAPADPAPAATTPSPTGPAPTDPAPATTTPAPEAAATDPAPAASTPPAQAEPASTTAPASAPADPVPAAATPTPAPDPTRADPAPATSLVAEAQAPPDPAPAASTPPAQAEPASTTAPASAPADPVPAAATPPAKPEPAQVGPAMVLGINCSQGHHNHPDAVYCSQCGTKMGVHHTTVLINGPRPPLGVLVVDDGTTYSLNQDLVIGREPTSHDDVIAGTATPMILTDDTLSLSRKHARIVLDDWSVLVSDLHSSNGTFLSRAGQAESWARLDAGATVALEPGDRLRVGGRIIQVELHHVR